MRCRHTTVRMNLSVFAMGRLDPTEEPALRAHLSRCAPCRAELDELEEIVNLLHQVYFEQSH